VTTNAERRLSRRLGTIAWLGASGFVLVAIAVQFLRRDLDWRRAPLSFYLLDDYGVLLQSAYFALAMALIALAAGYYLALQRAARSAAPVLLFVVGAVALCVTAIEHSNLPQRVPTFDGFVHGLAAQTAFLCVTVGMLLQSWRLRGDACWRSRFVHAFGYAMLCFAALWLQVAWRDAPRGLTQKILIALILGWLLLAAHWLRREPGVAARPSGRLPS
jgi:hypothetical protein